MKKPTNPLLILSFLLIGFTSCETTYNMKSIRIEVMKPGIFGIPKDLTVAVSNRDLFQSDTCSFRYYNGWDVKKDTLIKYHVLSNACVDAMADHLTKEGYFKQVINYRDSLIDFLKDTKSQDDRERLFETTKSDVCVFLDFLHFNTSFIAGDQCLFFSRVDLLWTITSKNDSVSYGYQQTDTLCYDESQVNKYSYKNHIPRQLLNNSCQYLGEFMGKKVIPTWIQVERMYYGSHNLFMLKAEKYARKNDWIKAAELWNRQTKSKNNAMATKAMYNMALACEMEGKPELSMDWLSKSNIELIREDKNHKENCERYKKVLSSRKLEIEKLATQIR